MSWGNSTLGNDVNNCLFSKRFRKKPNHNLFFAMRFILLAKPAVWEHSF